MASKTIFICDSCGKDFEKQARFSLYVDRQPDGAGSMEDIYEYLDLCPSCNHSILQEFLNDLNWEDSKKFLLNVKERKRQQKIKS